MIGDKRLSGLIVLTIERENIIRIIRVDCVIYNKSLKNICSIFTYSYKKIMVFFNQILNTSYFIFYLHYKSKSKYTYK